MRGFFGDVTLAARRLLATPLFTIFAVLSLAVGVGVTTAVYSVVDAIFLNDPGIDDPDQLVFVVTPYDGRLLKGSISEPDFLDLRSAQTSFSSVSASALFSPAVTSPSMTELLTAEAVDGAYFAAVGVPAAVGRTIQPSDAVERVVVLSHELWRARFGADPAIVGRTVRISGRPFEVIGIAPASFDGASGGVPGTKLWIPLGTEASMMFPSSTPPRDRRRLLVFGRLAQSVTAPMASAELRAIAARLDTAFPPRARGSQTGPTERLWRAKSIVDITAEDGILRRSGWRSWPSSRSCLS